MGTLYMYVIFIKDRGVVNATINSEFCMIDGKMRSLITGRGGAYCQLCNVLKEVACGHVLTKSSLKIQVRNMFNINRTMADTKAIYYIVKSGGTVMTSTGDYDSLTGVSQKLLTTDDSILSVSPLHPIMRTFDFVKQLAYHL